MWKCLIWVKWSSQIPVSKFLRRKWVVNSFYVRTKIPLSEVAVVPCALSFKLETTAFPNPWIPCDFWAIKMWFWAWVLVTGAGSLAILYFTDQGEKFASAVQSRFHFLGYLWQHMQERMMKLMQRMKTACLLIGPNLPSVIEQDGEKHTTEKTLWSLTALTKQFHTYFAWVYLLIK